MIEPPAEAMLLPDVPAPSIPQPTSIPQQSRGVVVDRPLLSDNSASSLFHNMAAEFTPTPTPSANHSASQTNTSPLMSGTYGMVVLDQAGNQSSVSPILEGIFKEDV